MFIREAASSPPTSILAEIGIDPKRKKIINRMAMLKYFFIIDFISLIQNYFVEYFLS
jgi:hypothetical protein